MNYEKLVKNVSLVTRENDNSRENGEHSKILYRKTSEPSKSCGQSETSITSELRRTSDLPSYCFVFINSGLYSWTKILL